MAKNVKQRKPKSMRERMTLAGYELADLCEANNDKAMSAEDFRYACLECGRLEMEDDPEDFADEHDQVCEACWLALYFECKECKEVSELSYQDQTRPAFCGGCADKARDDEIDDLRGEITSLIDGFDPSSETTVWKLEGLLVLLKSMMRK